MNLVRLWFALCTTPSWIMMPHALPSAAVAEDRSTIQIRSADTCADPSLTKEVFQAYTTALSFHALNYHWAFVNVNSVTVTNTWTDQHPTFRAWRTQQPFTVPLFQLATSTRDEYIYLVAPDAGTPPVISGFDTDVAVVAWVYDTPVCGSVALRSVVLQSQRDHYYTIDEDEEKVLMASGWSDSGIIGYVLPLSAS